MTVKINNKNVKIEFLKLLLQCYPWSKTATSQTSGLTAAFFITIHIYQHMSYVLTDKINAYHLTYFLQEATMYMYSKLYGLSGIWEVLISEIICAWTELKWY